MLLSRVRHDDLAVSAAKPACLSSGWMTRRIPALTILLSIISSVRPGGLKSAGDVSRTVRRSRRAAALRSGAECLGADEHVTSPRIAHSPRPEARLPEPLEPFRPTEHAFHVPVELDAGGAIGLAQDQGV